MAAVRCDAHGWQLFCVAMACAELDRRAAHLYGRGDAYEGRALTRQQQEHLLASDSRASGLETARSVIREAVEGER